MNRTAFVNGNIFTGDRSHPRARAILIEDNKIKACGLNADIYARLLASDKVIDLKGSFVMPGIIESHAHSIWGGTVLLQIDLSTAATKEDFIERIAGYAASAKQKCIQGGRWNEQQWPGKEIPSKHWVDAITGNIPLLLHRMDYHSALANSAALKLAGITNSTPDPLNGSIDRDENGETTGILRDAAIDLVLHRLPQPTGKELAETLAAAFSEYRKFGITTVHDIALPEQVPVLQRLESETKLPCRMFLRLPITEMAAYAANKIALPAPTEKLRFGSFKIFADGALGSSTAYFFEGYTDEPENFGIAMDVLRHDKLKALVETAEGAGFQLSIHSIGDRATAEILDVMEEVLSNKGNINRHRIEHVQHIRKQDIARFAQLGLIASVQPHHLYYDGAWLENRIGRKRVPEAYAFGSMLEAGIVTCFGSDFPIVTCNPFAAIKSAVTRLVDTPGHKVLEPAECISLEQALYAYTIDAAYAGFSEKVSGSLEENKFADFIVLDKDPFKIPPEELDTISVVNTVFNGNVEE